MLYACLISDIIKNFTNCDTIIMADVTYGACCIDDITADELNTDFIIHYGYLKEFNRLGHSCLIPINETCKKTMYVFVEISFET